MFGELRVRDKIYKIEYSIEASLYGNCTERVFSFMTSLGGENGEEAIIHQTSNIPSLVLELLYAGLLEHHGEYGDRTVMSIADAKRILKEYMIENRDKEDCDYASLSAKLIEQMGEDGFFDLIGLSKILGTQKTEE